LRNIDTLSFIEYQQKGVAELAYDFWR